MLEDEHELQGLLTKKMTHSAFFLLYFVLYIFWVQQRANIFFKEIKKRNDIVQPLYDNFLSVIITLYFYSLLIFLSPLSLTNEKGEILH